jgi:hypothetical protein
MNSTTLVNINQQMNSTLCFQQILVDHHQETIQEATDPDLDALQIRRSMYHKQKIKGT